MLALLGLVLIISVPRVEDDGWVKGRAATVEAALVLDQASASAAATPADGLDRNPPQSTKLRKLELAPQARTPSTSTATEATELHQTQLGAKMDSWPAA